jgi:hypothetical protein
MGRGVDLRDPRNHTLLHFNHIHWSKLSILKIEIIFLFNFEILEHNKVFKQKLQNLESMYEYTHFAALLTLGPIQSYLNIKACVGSFWRYYLKRGSLWATFYGAIPYSHVSTICCPQQNQYDGPANEQISEAETTLTHYQHWNTFIWL